MPAESMKPTKEELREALAAEPCCKYLPCIHGPKAAESGEGK